MSFTETSINNVPILLIDQFRTMDYLSVEKYHLPIELMMENAGQNLARLAASFLPEKGEILIGVGTGNNGGGGLVAARRLAGWGYKVFISLPDPNLKELPAIQLKRALAFGAVIGSLNKPDLFIDAYFGFSQRLPLPVEFESAIEQANHLFCHKISLDLPSGFNPVNSSSLFKPDCIITLAAMKTELLPLKDSVQIFVADIGIPTLAYMELGKELPLYFQKNSLLKIVF
ncbi:MAG: NAD(P)H-hydrate epimerase [Prolixibacteraceae bacterium]|jgi:NAD(P)H-hydrate epimerase|nr:NAD(P)H-hydrate epimerase [Prolixibacteraceae bacterium]